MTEHRPTEDHLYRWKWQHGPAPGLTFYSGEVTSSGPDYDTAYERAMRDVCQRGAFQRGCISLRLQHES